MDIYAPNVYHFDNKEHTHFFIIFNSFHFNFDPTENKKSPVHTAFQRFD